MAGVSVVWSIELGCSLRCCPFSSLRIVYMTGNIGISSSFNPDTVSTRGCHQEYLAALAIYHSRCVSKRKIIALRTVVTMRDKDRLRPSGGFIHQLLRSDVNWIVTSNIATLITKIGECPQATFRHTVLTIGKSNNRRYSIARLIVRGRGKQLRLRIRIRHGEHQREGTDD